MINPFEPVPVVEPELPTWGARRVTSEGDQLLPILRQAYYAMLKDGNRVMQIRAGMAALCIYESLQPDAGTAPETRYKTARIELDRNLPDDEMALDAQPGGSRYECVAKIVGIS